jgi:hypothetical protein
VHVPGRKQDNGCVRPSSQEFGSGRDLGCFILVVLVVVTLPNYSALRCGYGPVELNNMRVFGVASVARPII